ncbi:MAG: polyphenol oxidase family protein [Pseudomonadota bacterium]
MRDSLFDVEWGYDVEKKGDSAPLFEQVHGSELLHFKSASDLPSEEGLSLSKADGAIAYFKKAEIHVYTADCFPVLFFTEEDTGPIGAVHAGWKGIKKGIIQNAYRQLSHCKSLHAVIGPAIGSCCFAVRNDFVQEWEQAGLSPGKYLSLREGRQYFNLLNYVTQEALLGISKNKIHLEWFRCTACSEPSLPSFRRDKSANPRIRTWIRKTT